MPNRPHRSPAARLAVWPALGAALLGAALLLLALVATPAVAQTQTAVLDSIIARLQQVIVGLAGGLATLFLSIGGVRYVFAGEDAEQIAKAKKSFRGAAIGYGIATLSGSLFAILRYIVGA